MELKLNYVVTAYNSSRVTQSCVGKFTSNEYFNLILGKDTHFEIYKINRDDIELMFDFPIYASIISLQLIHPKDDTLSLLFIATKRYGTCLLGWDTIFSKLITRSVSMNLSDCYGTLPLKDLMCTVDPDCRSIGLLLYDGTFKVVPLDNNGELMESFNFRLFSLKVEDIKFLYGCALPTVAILYQDDEGARHAKTYKVSIENECHVLGPWSQRNLDNSANLLIPVPTPLCGVLIIGKERFAYCSANTFKEISKTRSTTKTFGRVDDFRYLLGDDEGLLHLLVVTHENQRVTGLTYELLGETSIASTISYLENSLVFVGSSCGESQLIKVDLDAEGSGLQVLKKFVNLGPINDLCILERNGKAQVVTCSGASKDASLRIVCKGISEQASLELQGIIGMWSLKSSVDEAFNTFLVVSFISETRILAMNLEDKLEEIEIEGFLSRVQTLFCHDAVYNQLVQVTSNSVRLVSSTTEKLLSNWDVPGGLTVSIATANASQVLLASDRELSTDSEQFVKRVGAPSMKFLGKRPHDPGRFSRHNRNGVQPEKNEVRELGQINLHYMFGIIVELDVKKKSRNNGCDEEYGVGSKMGFYNKDLFLGINVEGVRKRSIDQYWKTSHEGSAVNLMLMMGTKSTNLSFTKEKNVLDGTMNTYSRSLLLGIVGRTCIERLLGCFLVCFLPENSKFMILNVCLEIKEASRFKGLLLS